MSENRKVFLRGTRKVFLHFCKGSGRYFLQLSSIFARDPGKSAVKKGSRHARPTGGIWWLTLSNSYCSVCRDTSVPGLSGRQTAQRRFRPGSGSVRGPASGIRRRHPGSSYLTTPRLLNGQTQKTSSPTIWSSATQPTEALRESTDTLRWSPKTNIRFSGTW